MCVYVCGTGVCAYTCLCVCMYVFVCMQVECLCVCDGGGEGASSGFTSIILSFFQCDHLVLVLIQAEVQIDVHY